ncbi:shikimate dehydrogenase [Clostridium sp. MSJ-4]|uniref:Shikimate dehydrogenase (NADP(+)) n=1 Tax=Clostridium simiarum TaxID=2841506 RepID=A0ABS6EXH3_9CLOT|nr:shikimate dehydrogenase [Clostridium simiarum]MBU5590925.1 shikimate dehydrogenase [Clostridium simiarum]
MKICGLIGKNIQYSLSPKIHNQYYKDNNINLNYKLFDMEEEELIHFLKNIDKKSYVGFNVTIPYKQSIIEYLDEVTYPASLIGAVNTISIEGERLVGYNTDYFGFIDSLKCYDIRVQDKSALILGNGGAAKAVYYALKDLGVRNIDVAGRNVAKIDKDFLLAGNILNLKSIKSLFKYDIIINCTPLGNINNQVLPINLKNFSGDLVIYDLNYSPKKTNILIEAEKLGLKTINGECMLEHQAYKSIDIWCSNLKR